MKICLLGSILQVLHGKLVKKYEDKCNSEFHKLQNDCYIHFHIGYHLYKAGRTDLFSSIYLDLNFVGEKLKITGPADLLLDFRKYRSFITRGVRRTFYTLLLTAKLF